MKRYIFVIVCLCVSAAAYTAETIRPISEDQLLSYATDSYDKNHIEKQHDLLGQLNGTNVVVDYICSDLCPFYTVRVIHYELRKEQNCASAGGVEKALRIPVSIATTDKVFCFPKVLTDNWEKYQK
jgi:hypothetical protein